MDMLLAALLYGGIAGLTIPAGGLVARIRNFQSRWLEDEVRHSVMAFGGGVLIAAVALVLVPQGMRDLPLWAALGAFVAGGLLFAWIERVQRRRGGANAQFLAMVSDFVPEALALGALLAVDAPQAPLLALLIGIQNLPEGFNAWRELRVGSAMTERRQMSLFFALAALGPVAVYAGGMLLADLPELTATLMMAAAGGIMFLMFDDIIVEAHLENRQSPSLAALAGFSLAVLSEGLIG